MATKREGMQIGFACAGVQVLNTSFLLVFFLGGWGGVELDCMTLDIILCQTPRDKNQTFNPRAVETLESLTS